MYLFQDKETGDKYLDMGDILFRIETGSTKRKDFLEKDWPKSKQTMMEEKESPKVELPKTSKFQSCPYCDKKFKKSRLACHIYCIHDFVCPKCPTVTKLKAGAFKRHWKSQEHQAKIDFTCSSCNFSTSNLGYVSLKKKNLKMIERLK